MLNKKKSLIIAFLAVIFIAILLFFAFFYPKKQKPASEVPDKQSQYQFFEEQVPQPSAFQKIFPTELYDPTVKNLEFFKEELSQRPEESQNYEIIEPSPSPAISTTPKPTTSPTPKEIYSEEELQKKIFETLYPKSYLDTLSQWQDILVNESYIGQSERVVFQNNDEVVWFLKKGYAYLKENNIIEVKDADQFLNYGIFEWARQQQIIAEGLRKGEIPFREDRPTPTPSPLSASSSCKKSPFFVFADIIKKLTGSKKVEAFVCTPIECWKYGAGIGPIPGTPLIAPCCCCRAGKAPIGCLNAICICCNAIWDPVTHICGCDI